MNSKDPLKENQGDDCMQDVSECPLGAVIFMFRNASIRVSRGIVYLQLILYWEKALNKHETASEIYATHWNRNSSLPNVTGILMKNQYVLNVIK